MSILDTLNNLIKSKEPQVDIKQPTINFNVSAEDSNESKYEHIPVFTRKQYENARVATFDEAYGSLYRKFINSYVSLYDDMWIVGRAEETGEIIKTDLFCNSLIMQMDNKRLIEKIKEVEHKAIRAENMPGDLFCKFSYDLENQKIFTIHVELQKEYEAGKVYEDCGFYGGIHFVGIDDIDQCLKSRYTNYGNKLVILKPVDGHVYYEYIEKTYQGDAVYVEEVMYLDDVLTWIYLDGKTDTIRNKKDQFIKYLKQLDDGRDYADAIDFLENL